jgi:hypothetical protein
MWITSGVALVTFRLVSPTGTPRCECGAAAFRSVIGAIDSLDSLLWTCYYVANDVYLWTERSGEL